MILFFAILWAGLALFWLGSLALAWHGYAVVRPLREVTDAPSVEPQGSSALSDAAPPDVTVIFAARNEEERIEATVLHALELIGVRMELAAVDDRSADGTAAILKRLARRHPGQLRVHTVSTVPEGWIAKSHACQLAAAESKAEWLLFTDADTWMAPDTVSRALQYARSRNAAHLALTPHSDVADTVGRASLLHFLTHGIGIGGLVQRGIPRAFIGIGAFNLIRRGVYERLGGHEAFRSEMLDDLALGREVLRLGERTAVADGMELLRVRWADGPLGLIRATDKNFFAVTDYSLVLALFAAALLLSLPLATAAAPAFAHWLPQYFGIVDPPNWWLVLSWAPGVAWLGSWIPYRIGASRSGWGWRAALLAPLGFLTMAAAILNSAALTLRAGGVHWRDTFYPLEELRKFRRRRR